MEGMLQGEENKPSQSSLTRTKAGCQPRHTVDGESSPGPRLHEAKQALLRQFVQRSRRWSIADPQVLQPNSKPPRGKPPRAHSATDLESSAVFRRAQENIRNLQVSVARSRREQWVSVHGTPPASPFSLTWAPGRRDDVAVPHGTLTPTGAWSQWADLQEPSAASALLRTCPSVTDVSERPSDVSERRKSSEPQAVLARGASMESDSFPAHSESLRQVPASRKRGTTGLLQDRKGCSAESAMQDAVTHMDHSLTRLWINHNSKSNSANENKNSTASPVSQDTGQIGYVTSMRQDGTGRLSGGGPVSPVKALFCDDVQLQAFEEQSDDAVLQQLMQWTAQLLQRMLRAAEGATRSARFDLEAAVRELVEERKQCKEVQAEATAAHAAAQQADADRAAVQAQLDKEQARIATMREEVGRWRARVDELQTTYAAKREMVVEAQVAVGPAGGPASKVRTGSHPGEEGPGLGGSLRRAFGELGSLLSPKAANSSGVFSPNGLFSPKAAAGGRSGFPDHASSAPAPAGALQVQMLPCCSRGNAPQRPHNHPAHQQGEDEGEFGDGRVLAPFATKAGAPMLTHGMEYPPDEAVHPGEMIPERLT